MSHDVDAEGERAALAGILAEALDDVVRELRAIDLVDLVSFIRFGSYPALEDLLQSSTELFFRDGTLTFGWTAAVDMAWGTHPTVTLGMEFRHQAVSVFFDLSLCASSQTIEVASIQFDEVCGDADARMVRLNAAVADARLPKRATAGWAGRRG